MVRGAGGLLVAFQPSPQGNRDPHFDRGDMAGAPDGRARAEERPAGDGDEAATGARDACPICVEGAGSERGEDPLLVARLRTGYVRLASNQYFAGSTFFVAC